MKQATRPRGRPRKYATPGDAKKAKRQRDRLRGKLRTTRASRKAQCLVQAPPCCRDAWQAGVRWARSNDWRKSATLSYAMMDWIINEPTGPHIKRGRSQPGK